MAESQNCEVVGCLHHVSRVVQVGRGKTEGMSTYKFTCHFTALDDLLAHAGESVGRKIQTLVRSGGKFPQDRTVDISSDLKFTKTEADVLAELEALSPEMLAAQAAQVERMTRLYAQAQEALAKQAAQAAAQALLLEQALSAPITDGHAADKAAEVRNARRSA